MKYVVFLGDGMADLPIESLGGKTPLDVANHPHMDFLARHGRFGTVQTVPTGMSPGSDTANLSVFGYDPHVYYSGRSPLEAMSLGVPLCDTDVTYRCNFVTLSSAEFLEGADMLDYCAGEITSEEAHVLVESLNDALGDDGARLFPGFSYRHCMVLHNAKTGAVLTQPHDIPGQSVRGKLPCGENGELLRRWMERAYAILGDHTINIRRVNAGKHPANAIWFWGEGTKPALKPFYEKTGLRGAVVSAVDLIQGIGCCAGMERIHVEGATGTYQTNFVGKANAAIDAFRRGMDYVYVHLEAPDECGHQGMLNEKIASIEQIDEKILSPILSYLDASKEAYCALLMPDHPTPMRYRTHTGDPVPFALYFNGDAKKRDCRYCERDAEAQNDFLPEGFRLIDLMREHR